MEQRALGNSGIKASAIGLGLMSKSGTYGKFDEADASRSFTRRWISA